MSRRTHRAVQAHARIDTDGVLEVGGEAAEIETESEPVELTEEERLIKIGDAQRKYEDELRALGVIVD